MITYQSLTKSIFPVFLLCSITWLACNNEQVRYPGEIKIQSINGQEDRTDDNSTWVVIATPSGELPRYKYLPSTHTLKKDTSIYEEWDFLPMPVNQGYIIDAIGESKLPLEVFILAEHIPTGSIIEVSPLGLMEVRSGSKKRTILVGIPLDQSMQTIHPEDFLDFTLRYDPVKFILQSWVMNHQGVGSYDMIHWQNEVFARNVIKKGKELYNAENK